MISRDVEASVRPEDLPTDDLKDMAVLIGIEAVVKLLKNYEGRSVYFPKNWTRNFRQKWISQHFNGENSKVLGRELGVSHKTVLRALNEKRVTGPLSPRRLLDSRQTSMF